MAPTDTFILQQTRFLFSAAKTSQFASDSGTEVAFAGRSNAGKSSAINRIASQSKLAKTSKTPGRTQLINFFQVADCNWRLVDLPGYGYAKVPVSMKHAWQDLIDAYLRERHSLQGIFLIMDIRHPLTEFDVTILDWVAQSGLKCHILLSKADKLKHGPAKSTLLGVQRALEVYPDASAQLFSATTDIGWERAREQLLAWLQLTA